MKLSNGNRSQTWIGSNPKARVTETDDAFRPKSALFGSFAGWEGAEPRLLMALGEGVCLSSFWNLKVFSGTRTLTGLGAPGHTY